MPSPSWLQQAILLLKKPVPTQQQEGNISSLFYSLFYEGNAARTVTWRPLSALGGEIPLNIALQSALAIALEEAAALFTTTLSSLAGASRTVVVRVAVSIDDAKTPSPMVSALLLKCQARQIVCARLPGPTSLPVLAAIHAPATLTGTRVAVPADSAQAAGVVICALLSSSQTPEAVLARGAWSATFTVGALVHAFAIHARSRVAVPTGRTQATCIVIGAPLRSSEARHAILALLQCVARFPILLLGDTGAVEAASPGVAIIADGARAPNVAIGALLFEGQALQSIVATALTNAITLAPILTAGASSKDALR